MWAIVNSTLPLILFPIARQQERWVGRGFTVMPAARGGGARRPGGDVSASKVPLFVSGLPPTPVQLLYPVSRFSNVKSLQHLCRFCIRQIVRIDHIQELPLPRWSVQDFLSLLTHFSGSSCIFLFFSHTWHVSNMSGMWKINTQPCLITEVPENNRLIWFTGLFPALIVDDQAGILKPFRKKRNAIV